MIKWQTLGVSIQNEKALHNFNRLFSSDKRQWVADANSVRAGAKLHRSQAGKEGVCRTAR